MTTIAEFLSMMTSGRELTAAELEALYNGFAFVVNSHNPKGAGGHLVAAQTLSTGSANPAAAFLGRRLLPNGWRQADGVLDLTGVNNGLRWTMIAPGRVGQQTNAPRTFTYDAGKTMTFSPVTKDETTVVLVAGAGNDISVVGCTVTMTFLGGTSTVTEWIAMLAGTLAGMTTGQKAQAALARALISLTGTAGTIPATFDGGVLSLTRAPLVQVVQAAITAVDWNATTRTVTIGLDIATAGDSVANVKTALGVSATGADHIVQVADVYGSSGAGDITHGGIVSLTGGEENGAMSRGVLIMAQGGNKDLRFDARDIGAYAKRVMVELVNVAAADPPTVTVIEQDEFVNIEISAKIATSTAAHILASLRLSAQAMKWISARLADGSNGSGLTAAFASTALDPTFDNAALECYAGTVVGELLTLTDLGFTADFAALGGTMPAGSTVNVVLRIGDVEYEITAAVVA